MPRWSLDDIPWAQFDAAKLDPNLLMVVKAAALTEFNAARYTRYLDNVLPNDPEFQVRIHEWQLEEEQHGKVLGRYSVTADPAFDFDAAFDKFTKGYVIPVDVSESIRGSRVGEMVARCVVETGTSSFYTALAEATDEPVLKEVCKRIAADEFRHYRVFLDGANRYLPVEHISVLRRILVALSRLREVDDDELAYAFHCANEGDTPYDRVRSNAAYSSRVYPLYRPHHVERATGMVFKAAGLSPQSWLGRKAVTLAWKMMQNRVARAAA